jgi:hypothetical protein
MNTALNQNNRPMNSSISVVIPLFNGAPWIERTIESVLAQTTLPREVIVVDDGSTDGSPTLVRKYQSVVLLKNLGKGSSLARTAGLLQTECPYIAFLDQDDLWHPEHLTMMQETLEQHPEAPCALACADCFTGESPRYTMGHSDVVLVDPWIRFPFTMGIDGPSLALFRTTAVREVGNWAADGTGMGDVLLFLKLAALSPLPRRNIVSVGKRIHPAQQWLKVRSDAASYLGFRSKVTRLALDFRKSLQPGDSSIVRHERRWTVLGWLRVVAEAIQKDDLHTVVQTALQIDKLLQGEDSILTKHVFYCLMGALFPTHDKAKLKANRDAVFTNLLKYWPNDAMTTRTAIKALIGEEPLVT